MKSRSKVGLWDLADHQLKVRSNRMDGPRGCSFINWDNGPGPSDYWMRDICEKYHTDIEFWGKQGPHAWHIVGKDLVPGKIVSDVWKGPVVRLHQFQIHGPLPVSFQSKAQKVFLDGKETLPR